jgi:hypothetical protein
MVWVGKEAERAELHKTIWRIANDSHRAGGDLVRLPD